MGTIRNTYRILAGKLEWKRFGRHRRKWENNIKMDVQIVLEHTD
jgi:hypothetical protein